MRNTQVSLAAVVVSIVTTLAIAAFSPSPSYGLLSVQAPTANVVDVLLTEGIDREPVCVLRIKVGTRDTTNPWRAFRSNKDDDFSALVWCMSRLLGDCTTTFGHDTTPVLISGHIVQAQDVIGWALEDKSACL